MSALNRLHLHPSLKGANVLVKQLPTDEAFFHLSVVKPKLDNYSGQSQDVNSAMNQSKLEARENACESRLLLVLFLSGSDSGARFANQ